MIDQSKFVNRNSLNEDRIAICSDFRCGYIKRIKPLKFKIFGFKRYPKCPKHQLSLVFIDEFLDEFIKGVKSCIFDKSSLPPMDLLHLVSETSSEELELFVNGWMYCSPIGRGSKVISNYFDGLSKAYIKALSRKQKKDLKSDLKTSNRYKILRLGMKRIVNEYSLFLNEFRNKTESLYTPDKLNVLSNSLRKTIKDWQIPELKQVKDCISNKEFKKDDLEKLISLKELYDKILDLRTSNLLLGKEPDKIIKNLSPFELYSAYYEFSCMDLCKELQKEDINFGKKKGIKEKIRLINWREISSDWVISTPNYEIMLDPTKDCSEMNPLYRHKEWLSYLYYDLDLSLRKIGEICGAHHKTISRWLKKHKLAIKEDKKEWIDKRGGHKKIYAPESYYHPDYKPINRGNGRYVLEKHRYIIENYLKKNPQLKISKKFLIKGKYLGRDCIIHHINYDKIDNRIENLWIFEDQKDHIKSRIILYQCLSDLIKLGKIIFTKDQGYQLNKDFDISKLSSSRISELLKPQEVVIFKNIQNVKNDIKTINWQEKFSNWIIKKRQNQFVPYESITLDPYKDCSDKNPLYMHKGWLETVLNEEKYNLSDSRLALLCSTTKDIVRYWRRTLDVSRGRNWGFSRFINNQGRVWVKPKNYKNPVALNNSGFILEHRYIIEKYLNSHKNTLVAKECLDNQGFLLNDVIVHHINFDPSDNRLENLYIIHSESEHKKLEFSLLEYVKHLLKTDLIRFINGEYRLNLRESINQ